MKAKRFLFRAPTIFGTPLKYGVPIFIGFTFLISGLEAQGGDILRGGSPSSKKAGRPGSNTRTAAETDAARANAKDTLARTTKTLNSIRAMQDAARQTALKNGKNNLGKNPFKPTVDLPDVPNGLGTGGLKVSGKVTTDPTQWTGANLPVQETKKNGKTTVTIKQTEQQALLNWETFNVGKKTTVTFDQSKGGADVGKWIAFNKINDPTGNPTQILGNIKADGQVYLINTNGIIFGGSSQVNARGLTVSSLPINDNLIGRGLLNNPDAQFLFSGLAIAAGANGTPAFTPEAPLDPSGKYGDVVIQKGAILESPTDASKTGGRITLVGPNVTNDGKILTPDGQTILAAGLQVGFAAHASSDPSLRGLDAFVGAAEDSVAGLYAGGVNQGGLINSQRGNITLVGREVNLIGSLESTTSVSFNGRIDIQAQYDAIRNPNFGSAGGNNPFLLQKAGQINLGKESLIRILPEWDSKETAIGSELSLRSQINLSGKTIHLGEKSTIFSPNALVNVSAGDWLVTGSGQTLQSSFLQSSGQVYLDRDTLIDVSGSLDVYVPVSKNIITVDLRGAELADSPLQRDGKLRNESVMVDVRDEGIYKGEQWKGTPLANISGFANLIQKSVGELTTAGGTVTISAGNSVVARETSKINVSGGAIEYSGGMIQTTRLLTEGRLVDISDATPDVVYEGIFNGTYTVENVKFGVSKTYKSMLAPAGFRYDPGSVEGAAGGALSITASSMALDGRIVGKTITGQKQRQIPPAQSSLNLEFTARDLSFLSIPTFSPTPPRITFASATKQTAPNSFEIDANGNPLPLMTERLADVQLSSELMSRDGFGILSISNPDGDIVIPERVTLESAAGGKISLEASNITVDGKVISPGGSVSFTTYNLSLNTLNQLSSSAGPTLPIAAIGQGIFTLGSNAQITTAGLKVDDRLNSAFPAELPLFIAGGTLNINSYSTSLSSGGLLDVSGGVYAGPRGEISYGSAGSLSVTAGRDVTVPAVLGGELKLGATLAGYSGTSAGSLTLRAPAFQIGGISENSGVTVISEEFFNQGGFGKFNLTGIGLPSGVPGEFVTGMLVDSEVRLHPVVTGLVADTTGGKLRLRNKTREEGIRTPASLTFAASGVINPYSNGLILGRGDVIIEEQAGIITDAKGSVTLTGDTVTLAGSITTPGGSITISGASKYPSTDPNLLLPTVLITDSARLSAAGKVILTENSLGLRQGSILAGGGISVSGNIVAGHGAILDVSGTRGILDLPPSSKSLDKSVLNSLAGKQYAPVRLESNGGRITLSGSRMLYSDATLIGAAGGESATGGAVMVSSGSFAQAGTPTTTADANLIVRQDGQLVPDGFDASKIGVPLTDSSGATLSGIGNFTVSTMSRGGFDSLNLNGNVSFESDVSIRLPGSLVIANGGVVYGVGDVKLTAGYISIGQPFSSPRLDSENVILFTKTDATGSTTPHTFSPTYGSGNLNLKAGLIDIGNLSLQGIGEATFRAGRGDIRGNGSLGAAGAIDLIAGQLYPTTAGTFNLFAYDYTSEGKTIEGSITISAGSRRELPFSAGGTLGIYASKIIQGGVLRAPIGTINLGWDGVGTAPFDPIAGSTSSVPVTTLLKLTAKGTVSVSAIDPISRDGIILPFGISLDGNSWIDPSGNDITVSGSPDKQVNLSADEVVTEKGSVIDIRGGGDLYAYRWIPGNGGTKDVLASTSSFAIIPGFNSLYAPSAPFNPNGPNLSGEPGYVNSTLRIGDQITLADSKGVPAGTYTLLPARYLLLPGAYLVTPQSGSPVNTTDIPEGSHIVSGYRSNNLASSREGSTNITRFEIASGSLVRKRSEYQDFLANTVLRDAAIAREFTVPRLPIDSGYLSFSSSLDMLLNGRVSSAPGKVETLNEKGEVVDLDIGRGSLIDINSSSDILINKSGVDESSSKLVLNVSQLNKFGAESLLIGGLRSFGPDGSNVSVNTEDLELDNQGSTLKGTDIILVADKQITLAGKSSLRGKRGVETTDTLLIGDQEINGSGNGVLVRVSGASSAPILRSGTSNEVGSELKIGRNTRIGGRTLVLDSTSATALDTSAVINGPNIFLNSGQISLLLDNPGVVNPTVGLVLSGNALETLQESASSISLLSYSSLDVYGTGNVGSDDLQSLSLQAASIRGFNTGSGTASFTARNLVIQSPKNVSAGASSGPLEGILRFNAKEILLGENDVYIDDFASTILNSDQRILVKGTGSLSSFGDVNLITPLLSGESAATYEIEAGGLFQINRPSATSGILTPGGFGAKISLLGDQVRINSDITLPSGDLTLRAKVGNVIVGNSSAALLNLAGTQVKLLDLTRFTDGGSVTLVSDKGDIIVGENASISVAARKAGGDAGKIGIKASAGSFELSGSIDGSAGTTGLAGNFSLDVFSVPSGSFANLDTRLNEGNFTQSRDYRVRSGDVRINGAVTSRIYRVAADAGNIVVAETINASGTTGGIIDLKANGSLILLDSAVLDASGGDFDAAGKGGSITLEAGALRSGTLDSTAMLDLRVGSRINLSIASQDSASETLGKFSGTLHLRAPRNAANNDVLIQTIESNIIGASSILVEGVKHYAFTGIGTISATDQNTIRNEANSFLGAAGVTTAGYTAMLNRLTDSRPGLDLILAPGAELYNLNGSLTLGTTVSTATSDWNLATWRFGPRSAPGVLTFRASENLVLFNALSDGFNGGTSLWLSPLLNYNPLLPSNNQSWSFRLTAGADLSAASFRAVQTVESLAASVGYLRLGKDTGSASVSGGGNARTSTLITNRYQVIRTGSGGIDIQTGRSLQLLNPFASIYTAGTRLEDATTVSNIGDFVVPILDRNVTQGNLGSAQQNYLAQYSMAGGNVAITSGENIERKTLNNSGLIDDSSRQLPNNWLYRRGYVGNDGTFGNIRIGSGFTATNDKSASTTWWVDFSNFFQGVGALGGGNISLTAGRDVMNMDAVIPTNARTASGKPSAAAYVELGGGDLKVVSGRDINAGIYYVERGFGSLEAGGSITTNSTRSPSFGLVSNLNNPAAATLDPLTWMPTTLFVGKSSFDLTAANDLLLGPVSNPFLLPQGINNRFWYKSYFSTAYEESSVSAISLGGKVTYRNAITLPAQGQALPMLRAWYETQLLYTGGASSTSWLQPWLRLSESSLTPFSPVWSLSAASVSMTSLTSDINLVGNITTLPSSIGQIEILASGSVNALQPTGLSNILSSGRSVQSWTSSTLNLSDADPNSIPSFLRPITDIVVSPTGGVVSSSTSSGFYDSLASLFNESGSVTGNNAVLQTRQNRHTQGGLHRNDDEPLRIYAVGGDLSGVTLFSAKQVAISAAANITDIALYIQNNKRMDTSIVSAGKDIIAYNSSSPLRVEAMTDGNALSFNQSSLAGDIQISGPGTLQILAGRNLDLGTGSNNSDGTGTGITSIGNLRNPYLSTNGADIIVGAGIGPVSTLSASQLALDAFIKEYVDTPDGQEILQDIAPDTDFSKQSAEEQALLAIKVFHRILRDTGRNYNDVDSKGYRKYDDGFDAIKVLFPESIDWSGEILTQGRDIRTRNGGDIDIIAPGGGVAMAETSIGNPLAPPGIITESGGKISISTRDSVSIGIGRIFTLRGGDIVIWSSEGDIAAGSSSRTVQSAPPTRVVVDPQSAEVTTDLAGLATGGGIGVLATVEGVEPGDVDLIAPTGVIDAGDAGIRVSGNINLAAATVLNAGNISASGSSSGVPSTTVSAPSISAVTAASNTSAATNQTSVGQQDKAPTETPAAESTTLSVITVDVIGYGDSSLNEEEDENEQSPDETPATP